MGDPCELEFVQDLTLYIIGRISPIDQKQKL